MTANKDQSGLPRSPAEEEQTLKLQVAGIFSTGGLDFAPPSGDPQPEQVGPYKVLQVLGQGGMGVVYLAEQREPVRRLVALKLIRLGMGSKEVVARFESERQALALMNHPSIARVYDAGTTPDGRPYFVMEHVPGEPITNYCDRQRLGIRARLDLFKQVCEAVQHAHQKAIIHRDLKPSNVLVMAVDGRPLPKIIDFGVAKATSQRLTEKTLFTEIGQILGTPEYMSPEQAEMVALDIDTRTDIYSLGVLLYELLVGELPFDSAILRRKGYAEIQRIIREEEPPRPSTRLSSSSAEAADAVRGRGTELRVLLRQLRGDLDWITMKAMEKDRTRRYASASELAADIDRHLNQEAVLAGPPSVTYRLSKLLRRNKGPVAAALALLLSLALGLAASLWFYRQALENAAVTRARELTGRRYLYAAHMNVAQWEWERGNTPRVHEHLELERPRPQEEDLRSFDWHYLWRVSHPHFVTLRGQPSRVTGRDVSADLRTLALGSRMEPGPPPAWTGRQPADSEGEVTLWDTVTGELQAKLKGHRHPVSLVRFSSDCRFLVSIAEKEVKVWDAATREEAASLDGVTHAVLVAEFSPDGSTLATGDDRSLAEGGGRIRLWQLPGGKEIRDLEVSGSVTSLSFSSDGSTLAASGNGKWIQIWDVPSGKVAAHIRRWTRDGTWFSSVKLAGDGKMLATVVGNQVELWDISRVQLRNTLIGHSNFISSIAFSPSSRSLVSTSGDRTVKLWDVNSGTEMATLRGHVSPVELAAFSRDGKRLLTVGKEQVRTWNVEAARPVVERPPIFRSAGGRPRESAGDDLQDGISLAGHLATVDCLQFSPDGRILASGSTDGTVRLWEVSSGRELVMLGVSTLFKKLFVGRPEMDPDIVRFVAFSPSGRLVASANVDGRVKLWEVGTGKLKKTLGKDPRLSPGALAFSSDGATLLLAHGGGVRTWEADTGVERGSFSLGGKADCAAFSPDASILAQGVTAGEGQGEVKLWKLSTRECLATLSGHQAEVSLITFAPNGRMLASQSREGIVKLWDLPAGTQRLSFQGPVDFSVHLCFSPDGKILALGDRSYAVRLLDTVTGQVRLSFSQAYGALAFSPDGKWFAIGSSIAQAEHCIVKLWRAAGEEETLLNTSSR